MADMDEVVVRKRGSEFISVTLGPEGHKLSKIQLLRIVRNAIKNVREGKGKDVDLSI